MSLLQRSLLQPFLCLLAACSPSIPNPGTEDSASADGDIDLLGDTAAPEHLDGVVVGEDDEFGCADIYNQALLPAFELDIQDEEWDALERDYSAGRKEYRRATFRYGIETVSAMVRLKGNPNFSWFGDKMQFVISFNEDDPDARWHGLRKIALDASWYDPTVMRDRVSWSLMRQREDLPSACANNATLSINGEFYGVYGNIEYFDHEYLERAFGDDAATGTLWKYGSEPKANADAADSGQMQAFWNASSVADMEALGDVAQWTRMWAAETVLGDDDGFVCCQHNFYIYAHPTRGLLMIPWDFDDVMDVAPHTSDLIDGYGFGLGLYQQQHFMLAMADPTWRAAYVTEVEAMNALLAGDAVGATIDTFDAQIADAVAADSLHTWGYEERIETVDRMKRWVVARHEYVDAWVACERGSPVDADNDGLDSCSDLDDGTPVSDETCNGHDDDNNGRIDDAPECNDCARRDMDERHFLFCSQPRTWDEAATNCADHGAQLATLDDNESYYMAFFYAWPYTEPWWLDGQRSGECLGWDEAAFNFVYTDCDAPHPSICRLP
jgi:hypothetical protein